MRKITGKKGMQEYVVYTIFAIIGIVILTAIVLRLTGIWAPAATSATCETSVLLRSSALAKGTIISPELIPLKCSTQYKCYTSGGKCPIGYEKIDVTSDQDIKQKLADEMYDCWKMLGEGKIQFVSDSFIKEQACLPCAIITFDDKLKGKQITGFQNFLSTANTSSGITYMQYFTNAQEVKTLGDEAPIDTSKDQVILFSIYSASNWKAKIAAGTGAVGGLIIGCKVGAGVGTVIVPGAGTIIGCAGGALSGGVITAISSYIIDSYKEKKIIPSISLNEYSVENLKDCKSFSNI